MVLISVKDVRLGCKDWLPHELGPHFGVQGSPAIPYSGLKQVFRSGYANDGSLAKCCLTSRTPNSNRKCRLNVE